MNRKFRALYLGLAVIAGVACLLAPAPLEAASERVLAFRSHIQVHPDASMTVTENITVRTDQREIKRGIIRDFPTTYPDRFGNTVKVGFQVEEVYRDGRKEPYHIKHVANGEKIYIGSKEVFLPPGVYTYTIRYRTDRQLGYFQDFDELYWNVTGNGWTFPIDAVEAIIELPPGTRILQHAGYTGYQGEQGKDFAVRTGDNDIFFKTTRGLAPRQGLTVAVAWPKGVVRQPPAWERDPGAALAFTGLACLFLFYLVAWVRVGRDPAKGTIIPLFTPPSGFSPAAVRFVSQMGFDDKAFAAAVVDMAVKGSVLIQEKDDEYTLVQRETGSAALSKGEQRIAGALFAGRKSIELKNDNHTTIKAAIDALKKALQRDFEKIYFITHSGYLVPGIIITLLALGATVWFSPDKMQAGFGIFWLTIWTIACYAMVVAASRKWRAARGGGGVLKVMGALGLSLMALFFIGAEIIGLVFFAAAVSWAAACSLAAMLFLNAAFYHLLKAPTLTGRKIMDQIEGFQRYLSVAEQERLNLLNPPEKTPALFEKYLPYALALDVENEWSEQFADVLNRAGQEPYSPTWYSGRSWDTFDSNRLSTNLGSAFADAISSSSSPPGSSSGSGGGGFSGGGGGGGGGSGW